MIDLLSIAFLISHAANAIIALVLVISSLRLYFKTKISLVLLMVILMSSWTITNFLLIIPLIFSGFTEGSIGINLIATWNIIGSAIVPAVFIIFIDAFEGEIDPKKVSVAIGTLTASFFIAIAGILPAGDISISTTILPVGDLITMRWSPLSSLAIFPTVLACGVWTQKELNQSQIHAVDEKQLRQIKFMKIGGIFMFFIGPVFGIAGVIAIDAFGQAVLATILSEIVGYLFVSVGIIMITLAYTTSDAVAFLQPQRMDSLMAIFSTGVPIFKYDFVSQDEDQTDVSLISGAITAITAIMGEAFNVQSDIRQIAFYDKELVLNFENIMSDINIAYVLITDRKSAYLENSLERFSKAFTEFLPEDAVNGIQLTDEEYETAISMLRRNFGLSSLEKDNLTN